MKKFPKIRLNRIAGLICLLMIAGVCLKGSEPGRLNVLQDWMHAFSITAGTENDSFLKNSSTPENEKNDYVRNVKAADYIYVNDQEGSLTRTVDEHPRAVIPVIKLTTAHPEF